mgnify:CR=1 FL=1
MKKNILCLLTTVCLVLASCNSRTDNEGNNTLVVKTKNPHILYIDTVWDYEDCGVIPTIVDEGMYYAQEWENFRDSIFHVTIKLEGVENQDIKSIIQNFQILDSLYADYIYLSVMTDWSHYDKMLYNLDFSEIKHKYPKEMATYMKKRDEKILEAVDKAKKELKVNLDKTYGYGNSPKDDDDKTK